MGYRFFLRGIFAFFCISAVAVGAPIPVVDSSEVITSLNYEIKSDLRANACEFYVDGFGDGTEFLYHGVGGSLYETWIKAYGTKIEDSEGKKIVNVGAYIRFREQTNTNPEPVLRELLVIGLPTAEKFIYRIDFRYKWHSYDYDTTRTIYNFAYFIDIKNTMGEINRMWLNNANRDFNIAEVFEGYPMTGWINVGPGTRTVRYVENFSASPLFNQRRSCLKFY